jgi:outer membrane biosynthesis protein TonB
MKVGLTTSTALHAVALGFTLLALGSPPPHQTGSTESFPVDIVPIEEFSQSVMGDREAPLRERPAPVPTSRPEPVEDAQHVGDNTVDLPTPPTPDSRPRPVETAAAPPPSEEPAPQAAPEPEPQPAPEPPQAEATEPTPEARPAEPVTPEPEPVPATTQSPQPEFAELPDRMQAPPARPERPRPQTAQAPERRQTEEPSREQTASTSREEQEFDADQIAALLNRDTPSGGGAQRSTEEAALGGRQTTGATLAQSEIDSLRSQVSRCWNPPVGAADAENLVVSIRIRLSRSGELEGNPEVVAGGGASMAERAAADAARRAIMRCQPYNAPAEKYEAWADVQFNFDPRDMF